jgi:hypothetical protein
MTMRICDVMPGNFHIDFTSGVIRRTRFVSALYNCTSQFLLACSRSWRCVKKSRSRDFWALLSVNLIVALTLQDKSISEVANTRTQGVKKQTIPDKKIETNFEQVRFHERGRISAIWRRKHLILPTELALGRASDLPQNRILYVTKRTTVCHKTDSYMPQNGLK